MTEKPGRLMSLDALRGADMVFIMGFASVVTAFCTWVGAKDCWLATQMTHVAWHGFRHHDTIFPLFLFLAGVSWPFSYAGQVSKGRTAGAILRKIGFRVVALFALGLVTAKLFAFKFAELRYDTVLAHIGVCWALAALLYMAVKSWRVRLAVCALVLVAHTLLLAFVTAPDAAALLASTDPAVMKKVAAYAAYGTDGFSFTGNLGGWLDRTLMPGVLFEGVFDPDGILCKPTGFVLAVFGTLAGELLRRADLSGNRKTAILLAAGAVALALTLACSPWCPVNKKIWTATFVLAAASYSLFALALFYWLVDVRGFRKWTFFFRVIGMNSITIFVLWHVVSFPQLSRFFLSGVAGLGDKAWATLVFECGRVAVEWLVLYFLYRKNTFLRV